VNRGQENKLLKVENAFSNLWVSCMLIHPNIVILTLLKHIQVMKAVQSSSEKEKSWDTGWLGSEAALMVCQGSSLSPLLLVYVKSCLSSTVLGGVLGSWARALAPKQENSWKLTLKYWCYMILLIFLGDNTYEMIQHWTMALTEF